MRTDLGTAGLDGELGKVSGDPSDQMSKIGSADSSASSWDFGDRKEDPIHRIHAYPAKFPAFITTKALHYAEQQGVSVNVVADVFCGCGTTAVEAKRNGKNFWGCDINPVATLIARVKTYHYRDEALARYFADIQDEFRQVTPGRTDRARVGDRIRYWFDERNIEDLLRLYRAIRRKTPTNSPYRKFFLCAFSNILKADVPMAHQIHQGTARPAQVPAAGDGGVRGPDRADAKGES